MEQGGLTIDTPVGSPTFIGIRQCEFEEEVSCNVELDNKEDSPAGTGTEAGISLYMDCNHHYDIYLIQRDEKTFAECRVKIGPACEIKKSILLTKKQAELKVTSNAYGYDFFADGQHLAHADSRYLSSEVAGGFTGVFIGLYAQNGATGKFTKFEVIHKEE